MLSVLVLLLVVMTSAAAALVGWRGLRLPGAALGAATARTLECLGLAMVFLAANLALGLALILALGALSGGDVSVYRLDDATIVALSVLQGMVFRWWWSGRRGG
jgi:hypothetical protein